MIKEMLTFLDVCLKLTHCKWTACKADLALTWGQNKQKLVTYFEYIVLLIIFVSSHIARF